MGKRKSRTVLPKKKLPKLDTTFCCPFCNHPDSVDCIIDRKLKIGEAICRVCEVGYATKIHALTEPIDIYCEWVDACEAANAPKP
ncbi:hypothetical protein AMTRI_Chr09g32810 [Amborella trichopoda]|uniref:Transcription elongation factor 1 homolog n=1 Tax=Amborella trichopoda TaxID=13333 RepID=W1PHQ1_AMBTC|nr:transcription elongation factor 1 homolog [Amborella trichopoda]XP_020525351.1 transcription elongation factor 1 homolog [Amborella trichopoda]ERN09525.1 hypothetical protein AMTR_s00029p00137210 [Amborella trichopoda]ERN09527.1 hypothetical protein AMTR_s00029p00137890 [Amborella trichopoda]|eukprot:XP_020525280.1 transcription elongation factor 1 homolog [Amborella trichopoda]